MLYTILAVVITLAVSYSVYRFMSVEDRTKNDMLRSVLGLAEEYCDEEMEMLLFTIRKERRHFIED